MWHISLLSNVLWCPREQLFQKRFTRCAAAYTIYDVIKNFRSALLISATLKDEKARGPGSRPRREERHLSVSVSLALLHLLGRREGVWKGRRRRRRRGSSSCRRAVTLILITKATSVQSHNPLLCPMGVGVRVKAAVLCLYKPSSHTHTHTRTHTHTLRPGAIVIAGRESSDRHGDTETNLAMSAIYGKTERAGDILQPKQLKLHSACVCVYILVCVCVCVCVCVRVCRLCTW